jgi:hypothetical protein
MNTFRTLRRLGTLALLLTAFASHAQTLSCPQPGQLRQINACPTEEQLRANFHGFCGDDSKAYQGQTGPCSDYQVFRRLKNTALWESADGAFDGYLSCETASPASALPPLSGVRVEKKGPITALVCQYGPDTQLTHRTRKACTVPAACASDPAQCQVVCQ